MLADSGGSASVSQYIELAMPGIGPPATARLVAAGVRPSLNVDAEPSSPGDLFSIMRAALLAETAARVIAGSAPAVTLTERDVLAFATIEGARASGIDHEIGSLTPGKAADLVILDVRQPGTASVVDSVAAVVNHGHPGAVRDVLVAGRYVKKGGRMVDQTSLRKQFPALNGHATRYSPSGPYRSPLRPWQAGRSDVTETGADTGQITQSEAGRSIDGPVTGGLATVIHTAGHATSDRTTRVSLSCIRTPPLAPARRLAAWS